MEYLRDRRSARNLPFVQHRANEKLPRRCVSRFGTKAGPTVGSAFCEQQRQHSGRSYSHHHFALDNAVQKMGFHPTCGQGSNSDIQQLIPSHLYSYLYLSNLGFLSTLNTNASDCVSVVIHIMVSLLREKMRTFISILILWTTGLFINDAFAQSDSTATFEVAGNCGMCKKRIEDAAKIDGVSSFNWDIKTHIASVRYNPEKVKLADIQ